MATYAQMIIKYYTHNEDWALIWLQGLLELLEQHFGNETDFSDDVPLFSIVKLLWALFVCSFEDLKTIVVPLKIRILHRIGNHYDLFWWIHAQT